jgi:hypothetical protein
MHFFILMVILDILKYKTHSYLEKKIKNSLKKFTAYRNFFLHILLIVIIITGSQVLHAVNKLKLIVKFEKKRPHVCYLF